MQGEARSRPAHGRHAALFAWALLLLLLPLLCAVQTQAAPGGLDRSFGHGGTAASDLGPSYRETSFEAIEPQGDGSLLATRDGRIWRYGADGRLDPGFPPQPAPAPTARAVQEDGKVLTYASTGAETRLVRSNPDGSPDTTFSAASVPISVSEILPLPGGKILVAGTTFFAYVTRASSTQQIGLARFDANGALDTSFGNGGIVKLRSDYGIESASVSGLAARPGEASTVLSSAYLIGLTASGQVDSAYGNGGRVDIPGPPVDFHSAADDKLLVLEGPPLGCCETGDFILARYTATGALDPSYGGGDGVVGPGFAGVDRATGVRWGEDGSALVGGSLVVRPGGGPAGCPYPAACVETPTLASFTPDGRPDPSLGGSGMIELSPLTSVSTFLGIQLAGVRAIAPRPGGGLYLGGGSGPGTSVAFLVALAAGGGLDAGFGDGGIVRERTSQPSWAKAAEVAITGKGSILVGGETNAGAGDGLLAVARYTADGALDHGFGSGVGFVRIPRPLGTDWHLNALAVDREGRPVILAGKKSVIRLNPGGALDVSFGEEGSVDPNAPELHALVVLRSGKILVAGSVIVGKHSTRMAVLRLLPDGRPDLEFGHRGRVTVSFGRGGHAAVRRLAVQPDGRILLAGYVRDSMALARLMPNGSLDRSFGRRGRVIPPVGQRSKGTAVAMQGGKILLAGWRQRAGKMRALLLRYTRAGELDRSFARRGISSAFATPLGKKRDVLPEPVRILPTRRRIVVIRAGLGRPILAYRRDGRLDRSFGDSRAIAPARTSGPVGALQRGRVVLAWNAGGANDSTFALQRLKRR
jgi:uncharacterized delta-60 repeat protein